MRNKFLTVALFGLFLMCNAFSCNKEKDQEPNNNNGNGNAATTLPVNCDLTGSFPDNATSITAGGISFTRMEASDVYIATWGNPDVEWKECVGSGSAKIYPNNGTYKGITLSGVLIADVSNLPEIHKVTVKMFDNGKPGTRLSVCDGNSVIAASKDNTGENPEVTYTLNVGGKKASRLYIHSLEAIVYSVHIE